MNIFEKATREKQRFEHKGLLDVEDLWDLTTEELDSIYKLLKIKENEISTESLLENKTEDESLKLQLEIITHIVNVKLDERRKLLAKRERKQKNEKILAIIEDKENKELESKDIAQLKEMLE